MIRDSEKKCYDALREFGRFGDDAGATICELESRCNAKYGKRHQSYWHKQLNSLVDMGYAQKIGTRQVPGMPGVFTAADPWRDE